MITAWKIPARRRKNCHHPRLERESFGGERGRHCYLIGVSVSIVDGVGTILNKKEELSFE
jgi:hypothetical protein